MSQAVIFDFNRTLYDPDTDALVPGALQALLDLKNRGAALYLISRKEPGRDGLLDRFNLRGFFIATYFVSEKSKELFERILKEENLNSDEVYVVGDSIHEEIRFGNQCKLLTIRLKRGKFATELPEILADHPWREITEMTELSKTIPH